MLKTRNIHSLTTLIILLIMMIACSQDKLPENVLATVGETQITIADFKRAYIPVLLYSDKRESQQTREEVLNFLVEQSVLAQTARSLNLDTIPTLHVLRRTAEKTAFTRILYKEWVKNIIIPPSEASLRLAFERSHAQRLVRHLFTPNKVDADKIYAQLMQGAKWDSLAAVTFNEPTLANNGGILGWMKFGEMDPDFENAVYELGIAEISKPIATKFGWHIIRVDDQSRELMLTEYDYSLERRRLLRTLKERQEKHLADSVVNSKMELAQLQFNPEFSPRVWTVIRDQMQQLVDPDVLQELINPEMLEFTDQLKPILAEEMLSFSGVNWTVAEFLKRLPEMNRDLMLTNLKMATAFLVRDEIIHSEGLMRNLDQRSDVKGEVLDRENQFLANLYLRFRADTNPVSDQAVNAYFKLHSSSKYQAPDSIYIYELIFQDLNQAKAFQESNQAQIKLSEIKNQTAGFVLNNLGWFQGARLDRADYYHRLVNLPLNTLVGPLTKHDKPVLIVAAVRHRHAKPFESIARQVRFDAESDRLGKLRFKEVKRLMQDQEVTIELEKLHAMDWVNN